MRNNNQSNNLIKWIVVGGDVFLLNIIIFIASELLWKAENWPIRSLEMYFLVNNFALILSLSRYSTIIHQRIVGAGEVLKRIVGLTVVQTIVAYGLLRVLDFNIHIGWRQFCIGTVFFVLLLIKRMLERWLIKFYRQAGRNSRAVTLVGNDPELLNLYEKLHNEAALGYHVLGYYADAEIGECTHSISSPSRSKDNIKNEDAPLSSEKNESRNEDRKKINIKRLGSMQEFVDCLSHPDDLVLGDELYLCISRRDKDIIRRTSRMCDHKVIRFYYLPVSVESIGLNLKSEMFDDLEVYTTYENPLENPLNRFVKRTFDIVLSLFFLIPTAIMFPFIWAIIKIQSPGPLFFRQKRTGLDGKEFEMLKFRSMHVNKDADKVQATKNDPRKFPFGNFMRKSNIDELPQFLNILKGDMSFVGPRPHMLMHTEMYSKLIDEYMVRHFVKPGLTGWAQVTGFRGETKELWQMEGRVKRDIWYMENWTIWLDIRIIWMTVKTIFIHDKNAY